MKSVIGLFILGGMVAGVVALNNVARESDGKSVLNVAGELEVPVESISPEQGMIVRTVQAPGTVEALQEVDISAEVVGKILEMPVEEGNKVKKGDLLCRLDDEDYRARLISAEAHVAKLKASVVGAEADLEKAERDFKRQTELSEVNATSMLELADYKTTWVRFRSMVEVRKQELIQAEAELRSSHENLQKTVIRSPIDGIVSQRFAKQGEVVVTGTMNNLGTRIMVVSDMSKMQVRCRVDESDSPLVKTQQSARIYLQSDTEKSIAGHVDRVCPKGTKPTGRDMVTFETLVLVDSDDARVKSGMTANVEIEVARQSDAVTIPIQAVVNRRRKDLPKELVAEFDRRREATDGSVRIRAAEFVPVVWSIVDGTARPRLVETGISDDLKVEVKKGVELGDRVVTGPYRSLDQLKDGSKVKVEGDKKDEKFEEKTPGEAQANAGG